MPDKLQDRLIDELRLIFDSEMQKVDVLWDMAAAAESPELKQTFTKLWDQTLDQINHLEKIFTLLDSSSGGGRSEEMALMARRCAAVMLSKGKNSDEHLLEQAGRMWIHEIAGYLTARAYAALLGHASVEDVLQEILREEEEAEQNLSRLTRRFDYGKAVIDQAPIEFPGFAFLEIKGSEEKAHPFELGKNSS